MKINKFEEIIAWQKARELNQAIYSDFANCNDYSFRDQIQRAVVSIMNNIAEGFERKTNNEFRQFLYISKGSCGEVKSMLLLAEDLGYIDKNKIKDRHDLADEISRLLFGLIKAIGKQTG